jgi:four helix bundle protein
MGRAEESAGQSARVYDLEERLVDFGVLVCTVVESLPSSRVGKHVAGQLVRCGTAPGPIYGEAQSGESRKDFIHKMRLCLKELRETLAWLKFVDRMGIGDSSAVQAGIQETGQLIRIFYKSIQTAERNDKALS